MTKVILIIWNNRGNSVEISCKLIFMAKGDNRISKLKQLAIPHLLFLISPGNSSEKSQEMRL